MKVLLLSAALAVLATPCALAGSKPAECKAVKVLNDNIFEEGFSTDEYPSTYLDKYKGKVILHVGAHWLGDSPGEKIETRRAANGDIITGSFSKDQTVLIIQTAKSRYTSGKLVVKEPKKKAVLVALLKCKSL